MLFMFFFLLFYFFEIFEFCVLVFCLHVWLCTMCVQCPGRPEEAIRPLEPESQMVVSCPVGAWVPACLL